MKIKFLILLLLFCAHSISAQLTIAPGAQFSIFSDTKLTLENSSLINNGNFLVATTTPVSFTGNSSSFIGGDEAVRFFKLEINKTGNQSVSLQKTISIGSGVFFVSGFLNLNGFDLDLETTAHLDGETEASRVVGPNGGKVIFSTNLNSPTNSNPANLGVFITSGQNLGNVIIKRGHQSQVNNGAGNTILRYYDIIPDNNTNLNGTLRLIYFDRELNNLDENSLVFLESQDNINWTNLGFTSRNTIENFVEKSGVNSFGRFTLSNPDIPLPVRFVSFNAKCEGDKILLTWKTAREQHSSHYTIEKSIDGSRFTAIGNIPAAGNSGTENNYSFTVDKPVQNNFYRIAEYDLDGRVQYTSILRSSCAITDAFNLWPNPVRDMLFVNIGTGGQSQATIKLFDSKGALVKAQRAMVSQGNNQLTIDLWFMTKGVYHLSVVWDNGQKNKIMQIIKR